jgi:hypothetical protein
VAGVTKELVILGLGGLLRQRLLAVGADEALGVTLFPENGQRVTVDGLSAVGANGALTMVIAVLAYGLSINLKSLSINA